MLMDSVSQKFEKSTTDYCVFALGCVGPQLGIFKGWG